MGRCWKGYEAVPGKKPYSKGSCRRKRSVRRANPTNPTLYAKVKREAKRKFDVWPSAYASGWLVREYKKRGGKYSGSRKASRSKGVGRWFREKWINVCELPKKVACGRSQTGKRYPYCRPSKRISKKTPRLASSLSAAQIKKFCKEKRKNPKRKMPSLKRKKSKKRRRNKSKK